MLNGIKRSAQRRLAVFLAVLMLMACAPVSILADETDGEIAAEELTEEVSVPEDEQIPEEPSLSESEEVSEEAGEITEDVSASESEELQDDRQSETTVPEGYVGVWTKDDLFEVRSNPSGRYIQMADIIFTEEDFSEDGDYYNMGLGWEPIGTSSTPFKGVYDGNGYVIRNLKIASDKNYCGLFGYANEAKLKNIVLENADISGRSYVGGIVGYITGDGDDSVNSCSVGGSIHGKDYVGGIAGEVDSYVSVDKNRNSADVSGEKNVGGIAGYVYSPNSNSVSNSYNTGSISGSSYTGGIIGYGRGGVSRSYSIGSVTGTSNFGGIAGVGSATYSYYLYTGVTNPTNTAGTPKDTAGLKKQGTYEQWDFGSIWTMEGDANYPYAELQCLSGNTQSGTTLETDEEGRIIVRTKDDLFEVRSNPSGSYIQMADIIFTEEDFSEDGDYYNMGQTLTNRIISG